MATFRFPAGFVWGTATAAHQVEGGNWNNDWWEWEHNPSSPCVEPSGDACDHWHRFPADIALLGALGFTTYRFSVEWSRIEPEEGEFSRAALDQRLHARERAPEVGFFVVRDQNHRDGHAERINREAGVAEWPPGCLRLSSYTWKPRSVASLGR